MKLLLPAIKTALHAHTIVTTDNDIYITPDLKWRPAGTGTPCIGIHGAPLDREELGGEMWELTANVEIAAFVALSSDGYTCLTGTNGVYAILDGVVNILKDNLLSVTGVQAVKVGGDSPSSVYQATADDEELVTITITFTYTLERSSV